MQIRIPRKKIDPDRVVYALKQEDRFWTEIVREIGPESETLSYFPIGLQWGGHKIDLTLGHQDKKSLAYIL